MGGKSSQTSTLFKGASFGKFSCCFVHLRIAQVELPVVFVILIESLRCLLSLYWHLDFGQCC